MTGGQEEKNSIEKIAAAIENREVVLANRGITCILKDQHYFTFFLDQSYGKWNATETRK